MRRSRAAYGLLILALGAGVAWPLTDLYFGFNKELFFFHDSSGPLSYFGIFLDYVLRGWFPLWTYALNGGQPVWPVMEAQMPVYDPIALIVGLFLGALKYNSHSIYAIVILVWIIQFHVSLFILARKLDFSSWLAAAVVFMVAPGIVTSTGAQPFVFLHARYAPLIAYALLCFGERPSPRTAAVVALGLVAGAAGVNTPYLILGFLGLAAALLSSDRRCFERLRRNRPLESLALAAGILLAGFLPLLCAGKFYLREAYMVNRVVEDKGWSMSLEQYFIPFSFSGGWAVWHNSLFITAFAAGAIVACAGFLFSRQKDLRGLVVRFRITFWLGVVFAALTMGLPAWLLGGRRATFLTMRNWGFLIIYTNLALAFCAAYAFRLLAMLGTNDLRKPARWGALVLALALLGGLGFAIEQEGLALSAGFCVALIFVLRFAAEKLNQDFFRLAFFAIAVSAIYFTNASRYERGHEYGEELVQRILRPGVFPSDLAPRRLTESSPAAFLPYKEEGPTAFHVQSAFYEPDFGKVGVRFSTVPVTHLFRTKRYQALLESGVKKELWNHIMGVDRNLMQIVGRVQHVGSLDETLSTLKSADPTFLDGRVLVETVGSLVSEPDEHGASGLVEGEMKSPGTFEATVKTGAPAWLFWSQGYDPNWTATIQGTALEIHPANAVGMAVQVPAGDSVVRFQYRPAAYIVGCILRLVLSFSALGLVINRIFSWKKTRPVG